MTLPPNPAWEPLLDALLDGAALDQVLAEVGSDQEELRQLLQTAALLPQLTLQPTVAAEARSLQQFQQQAARVQQHERRVFGLPQRLAAALAAAAAAVALGGGAVFASAAALPGDLLYPVKRTSEAVELAVSPDRAALEATLANRRRAEAAALVAAQRSAVVRFRGPIEQIDGDRWIVGGVPVLVRPGTLAQRPQLGQLVTVEGVAGAAGVQAGQIVLEPLAAPTAAPAPSAAPTITSAPTGTSVPAATSAPASAAPPPPAATALPIPTQLPAPTLAPAVVTPPPPPATAAPARQPTQPPAVDDDDPTPQPTDGPDVDDDPTPQPTEAPDVDDDPTPRPTEVPDVDDDPTPRPTEAPDVDDDPTPQPTEVPGADDDPPQRPDED